MHPAAIVVDLDVIENLLFVSDLPPLNRVSVERGQDQAFPKVMAVYSSRWRPVWREEFLWVLCDFSSSLFRESRTYFIEIKCNGFKFGFA